MILSFDSSLA